jgi:hypothetical protein
MMKQPSAVEATLLYPALTPPLLTVPKQSQLQCIDRNVGQMLREALSELPERAGGERHYRLVKHLDICKSCREVTLDHAIRIAINQIAAEKSLPVRNIMRDLNEISSKLKSDARRRDIPLQELVREFLTI